MAMFRTKYLNNSRTVTGTPQLFNNDVILNCNTSLGTVIINLLDIPANYWSTQWKLYIVDSGNNSSVNNITINAGAGQTINGLSSLVVSTNGAQIIVQISSDTDFIGLESYCCSTGGVVTSIIAGTGISVDQPTGDVTVTAIGTGIVSLTFTALTNLITTNTVVNGQRYLVTNAIYTDGGIVLTGTSTESVSSDGHSFHLNADYQSVGVYTSVVGFSSQLGLWDYNLSPVVGDVVIWNNFHYVNNTGANSSSQPQDDSTNWTLLTLSVGYGYIQEIDFSIYDITTNKIIRRQDRRNNIVELSEYLGTISFLNFQWGNDVVINNKFIGNQSTPINIMNCFWVRFKDNIIEGRVTITDNLSLKKSKIFESNKIFPNGVVNLIGTDTLLNIVDNIISGTVDLPNISTTNTVSIYQNNLGLNTNFTAAAFTGTNELLFYDNFFANDAELQIETVITGGGIAEISNNTHYSTNILIGEFYGGLATWRWNNINTKISTFSIVQLDDNALKGGEASILTNEYSNFPKQLDMSIGSVFSGGVLQLGTETHVGKYFIISGSGNTIDEIQGGVFDNIELISSGTVSDTFVISYNPIASATSGQIIGSAGINPIPVTFTSYAGFSDNILLKAIGTGQYFTKQTNVAT